MRAYMRSKVWAKTPIYPDAILWEGKEFKEYMKFVIDSGLEAIRNEICNEIDKCTCKAIKGRLINCLNDEYNVMILATLYKDETEEFLRGA